MTVITDTHATVEELLEVVFSAGFVQRLYQDSPQAVKLHICVSKVECLELQQGYYAVKKINFSHRKYKMEIISRSLQCLDSWCCYCGGNELGYEINFPSVCLSSF